MARKKKNTETQKAPVSVDFDEGTIDASNFNQKANVGKIIPIVIKLFADKDLETPFYTKHTSDKQMVGLGKRRKRVVLKESRTYLKKGFTMIFKDETLPGPAFLHKVAN